MKDKIHRNYDYYKTFSKQEQLSMDLLRDIMHFIKNTRLKKEDWFLLDRLVRNLESGIHPNKVLRGIKEKFVKVQKQYQK